MCGAAVLVLGAGCSSSTGGRASTPTSTTIPTPAVQVTSSIADGAKDVPIGSSPVVKAVDGTLRAVTLTAVPATGPTPTHPVPAPTQGTLATDTTAWTQVGGLAPHTTYRIAATAVDGAGHASEHTFTFTTGAPVDELHTQLNVVNDHTYGVGMPIIVVLNHPVASARHAALTDRLTVAADHPVTGAWHWFSDTELHWRPSVYWPAGTKVSLGIDFANFDAGDGIWGVDGRTVSFAIGDAHISHVDTTTHQMVVTNNGQVVRTLAVSTGQDDKYPTKSGVHVVNEKAQKVIMDSATVGIPRDSPDGYYEEVSWNVRISNSGEFVHSAPWSVGAQGNSNVSHGCVNAAPADAEWFFGFSQVGDVVEVVGTAEQLQPTNGYGDWQIPFAEWAN